MEFKYRRKTIYKAGSAILFVIMAGLIIAAFLEEGTG